MEQLARAHAHRERQPLRDLRPDLPDGFVSPSSARSTAIPTRRYQSVGEFESALRESLDRQQPAAGVTIRATPRRKFGFAFVAAVAALVLAVVALIVWTRATESNRGTALSAIRSIAVLPMSEAAGSGLPAHFADGLTDEIISTLGQVHALSVKSGLSVKSLKELPPKEIADRLGADAWLETTLSTGTEGPAAADSVRVRANLIAAGTQTVVWTKLFERPRGETPALQADLVEAIVRAVGLTTTPGETERLKSVRQSSPAAEGAYLLGRFHLDQYGAGSADQALKAFERAIMLDSRHAAAYAGAARANVSLGLNGVISNEHARALALGELTRALEFDRDLAEARATLGYLHFIYDWDWTGAEREFRRSLDLNPNSPYARTFYAEFLAALGRFDEALVQTDMAKRLDPESGAAARRHALVLYYKHDFAGAERALEEGIAIEPNAASGALLEGRIDEARGRFAEALDETRRASDLSGGGGVPLRVQLIRHQALAGQREEALADFLTLQREAASQAIRLSARDIAYIQLAMGNKDAALASLERAVADHDPTVVWIGVDPRLDGVRGDARFRRIAASIGLPH